MLDWWNYDRSWLLPRELGYIDWIDAFHKLKAEQGGSK